MKSTKQAITLAVALSSWSSAYAQTISINTVDDLFRTKVVLNEKLQVDAIIDTGAVSFGVCAAMATHLQLSKGTPVELETSNGRIIGHRTQIRTVRIGRLTVHDVAAVVHPSSASCSEALVGMTFLRRLRAVILRGRTLDLIGSARPSLR